jgi:hypothetical protein
MPRRPVTVAAGPGRAGRAECEFLGNGGDERDPHGQMIDRLAVTDGGNPPVVEERPRRRQGRAEHDPAGGDRRSGEPEAQPGGGVAGADAKVVMAAARTSGEGGEASRGHEVQHRVGRRGQQAVHSEVVEHEHGDAGGLRREPASELGDAWRAHQVSICLSEG